MKIEHNNKRSSSKYSYTWRLNNTLLSDQWGIDEIVEEIKQLPEFNE
jgi:hypothetical protein